MSDEKPTGVTFKLKFHVEADSPAAIGLYMRDGEVYLVRPAKRDPSHRYAVHVGDIHEGNWGKRNHEYIPGLVMSLKESERLTEEQVFAYGHDTGYCAWCGYELTNPTSIRRGIGPQCYRSIKAWLR